MVKVSTVKHPYQRAIENCERINAFIMLSFLLMSM